MMMRAQNINPIAHPEMQKKMKAMSAKYCHTKPKKGYTLECLTTESGTKYQRMKKGKRRIIGKGHLLHSRRLLYQRSDL